MKPGYIKAAVLEELNKPLQIRTLKLPELKDGQVLVKILYSGVCRSQLMEARGGRGDDPWLPHLLGHEASGVVADCGAGVTKVRAGDEVILGWIRGEGMEAPGARYQDGDQIINSGGVTTFSNYSIVAENRIVQKPEGLSFKQAVLFGCALPTGFGMVMNELKPEPEQSVAVLGLGGIGISALMALRAYETATVIAIDTSDQKLALARELGATHCINPGSEDAKAGVERIAKGGVDLCVESAGSARTIEMGFSLIRKGGGRLLFASHPPEDQVLHLSPFDLISGKNINGSWGGATRPDRDVPRMYEIIRKTEAPLDRLLEQEYRLEDVNQALDDMEQGKVLRPIIAMKHH